MHAKVLNIFEAATIFKFVPFHLILASSSLLLSLYSTRIATFSFFHCQAIFCLPGTYSSLQKVPCILFSRNLYITYIENENADKHSQEIKMSTEKCRKKKKKKEIHCVCEREEMLKSARKAHDAIIHTTLFMVHNFSWIKQ